MESSALLRKTCAQHEIQIKYFCREAACTVGNRLGCAECFMEGEHSGHSSIKYEQFCAHLSRSVELARKSAESLALKDAQKGAQNQGHPDLVFQAISSLSGNLFRQIEQIVRQILEQCEQEFVVALEKLIIKKIEGEEVCNIREALALYQCIDTITKSLRDGSKNSVFLGEK
jgi:hypothetical protein